MTIAHAVNEWFADNRRDLPWRRAGFGAWGILISEVMLQQTPVVRVIDRIEEWLKRWPTPGDLASVPSGEAVRAWNRLGYPRRALNLHAAAVVITEQHGGVVPSDVRELLALPGAGEYTARAVSVFAYGMRHPVVDTNVRRVITRAIDGHESPRPPSTRRDLAAMESLLPESDEAAATFNAAVMELGAIVCTSRAPRCGLCPIADQCRWRADGYPAYLGPRAPVQPRFEGSDRQVRGLIIAALRGSDIPVIHAELAGLWTDAEQFARSLDGLLADGLTVSLPEGYTLPG